MKIEEVPTLESRADRTDGGMESERTGQSRAGERRLGADQKRKEKELKDALQVKDVVIRKLQSELADRSESFSFLTHKNRVLSGEVARMSMSSAQSPTRENTHAL